MLIYVKQKASVACVTGRFCVDLDMQRGKRIVPNAPCPVGRFVMVEPEAVCEDIGRIRSCVI